MGINWESGLLSWKDHTPSATEHYTLAHLHPFVQRIELTGSDKHADRTVELYVSFGLHTFTRAVEAHDGDQEIYRDNREARTFCQPDIDALSSCRASSGRLRSAAANSHVA